EHHSAGFPARVADPQIYPQAGADALLAEDQDRFGRRGPSDERGLEWALDADRERFDGMPVHRDGETGADAGVADEQALGPDAGDVAGAAADEEAAAFDEGHGAVGAGCRALVVEVEGIRQAITDW